MTLAVASVGSNGVEVIDDFKLEWLTLLLLANISFNSSIVFLLVPFWLAAEVGFDVEIRHEFAIFGLVFIIS